MHSSVYDRFLAAFVDAVAGLEVGDGLDEAIAEANRLPFGLASYVWTSDLGAAARITTAIEAGSVAVNSWLPSRPETPFGGFHQSGLGTEGGTEGLRGFLRTKYVTR